MRYLQERFFRDYRVESNYNNMINVEISTDTLISVLRSANEYSEVTMRLAKRGRDPLLSFAVINTTHTGAKMELEHEVLIRLLKPPEWEQIREPHCPEPDVHILLPRLLKLRTVAERMARMDAQLSFSANLEGVLTLSVVGDDVQVRTTWKDLSHPAFRAQEESAALEEEDDDLGSDSSDEAGDVNGREGEDEEARQERREQKRKQRVGRKSRKPLPSEMRSVTLEMRSFNRFLSSYNVETSTIAAICVDHCAIFYVYIGSQEHAGGVMTVSGLVRSSELADFDQTSSRILFSPRRTVLHSGADRRLRPLAYMLITINASRQPTISPYKLASPTRPARPRPQSPV